MKKPVFKVIIPARYASSRLPGKPLLDIQGKPMIQHVWQRACLSDAEDVIIATDHEKIATIAEGFGAHVCLTRDDHESGTDRLQEVVNSLNLSPDEIIVNVQGDEPLIPPVVINQVAELIVSEGSPMATLYEKIHDLSQLFDPNVVKLVTSKYKQALYFSRAPFPWDRDNFPNVADKTNLPDFKRHVGLYAYRVALLNDFVSWPIGSLESLEKLEQLRVLENGTAIAVDEARDIIPAGVDTPEDIERVRQQLAC